MPRSVRESGAGAESPRRRGRQARMADRAAPLAELDDSLLLAVESRFEPIDFDQQDGLGIEREAELEGGFEMRMPRAAHCIA